MNIKIILLILIFKKVINNNKVGKNKYIQISNKEELIINNCFSENDFLKDEIKTQVFDYSNVIKF